MNFEEERETLAGEELRKKKNKEKEGRRRRLH